MRTVVAGAFDVVGCATAAANDLHANGFTSDGIRVTSNPCNPDGMPGTSLLDEAHMLPVMLEGLFSNLFALGEPDHSIRARRDHVRCGGVVVLVPVKCDSERVLALNILRMHGGVEIAHAEGGVPLY